MKLFILFILLFSGLLFADEKINFKDLAVMKLGLSDQEYLDYLSLKSSTLKIEPDNKEKETVIIFYEKPSSIEERHYLKISERLDTTTEIIMKNVHNNGIQDTFFTESRKRTSIDVYEGYGVDIEGDKTNRDYKEANGKTLDEALIHHERFAVRYRSISEYDVDFYLVREKNLFKIIDEFQTIYRKTVDVQSNRTINTLIMGCYKKFDWCSVGIEYKKHFTESSGERSSSEDEFSDTLFFLFIKSF